MSFITEDFRDSDENWLAQNLFSQALLTNNDIAIYSNLKHSISNSKNEAPESQIIEIKPLYISPKEAKSENEQIITNETDCDLKFKDVKTEPEFNSQEIIPITNQLNSMMRNENNPNFELSRYNQEPQQYLEVFMSYPEIYKTDQAAVINETKENSKNNDSQFFRRPVSPSLVKCKNCFQIFNENSFGYHVCDYDWTQNLVSLGILQNTSQFSTSSLFHPLNKKLKERLIRQNKAKLPHDPPCFRQLRENIRKLRKFIKDELKIDLVNYNEKKLDGPHECTLCERKFVHASGLGRHMEKHAMDLIPSTNHNLNIESVQLRTMIKCLVCGRLFFKINDAMNHLLTDHQGSSFKGDFPENVLSEEFINLLIEKENHKNCRSEKDIMQESYLDVIIVNDALQCEFCEYIFSDCSHLLLHSAFHDPNTGFECVSCEIQVPTSKEIFLHWQAECVFARELIRENYILQRFYTCNVCENKFTSLEQLTDHRYMALHFFPRRKHGIRILQIGCEYCGCVFDKIKHLVNHREEKHLKKLIEKKGVHITQGNNSEVTNQKLRQYLCDICGKSYTQSSHLWQHLRFHRGVKPFSCKEPNCGRSFTIRPDLNDHIRKCHTGERPYQCLVCGKRFLTGSVYYQHRLIHRGDRRYACDECGKRFYRADALKNHQRIHTGEKPYSCLYCTKNFRQRGDRDKHIRARHSNLDENAKNVLTALKNGQIPPPQTPEISNSLLSSTSSDFLAKSENLMFIKKFSF